MMKKFVMLIILLKFTNAPAISELDIQNFKKTFQDLAIPLNLDNIKLVGHALARSTETILTLELLARDMEHSQAQNLGAITQQQDFFSINKPVNLNQFFANEFSYWKNIQNINKETIIDDMLEKFGLLIKSKSDTEKMQDYAKLQSNVAGYIDVIKDLTYNANAIDRALTLQDLNNTMEAIMSKSVYLRKLYLVLSDRKTFLYEGKTGYVTDDKGEDILDQRIFTKEYVDNIDKLDFSIQYIVNMKHLGYNDFENIYNNVTSSDLIYNKTTDVLTKFGSINHDSSSDDEPVVSKSKLRKDEVQPIPGNFGNYDPSKTNIKSNEPPKNDGFNSDNAASYQNQGGVNPNPTQQMSPDLTNPNEMSSDVFNNKVDEVKGEVGK